MKFGFIAHAGSVQLQRHIKMIDLADKMIKDIENGYSQSNWSKRNLVPFIDFGRIVSQSGATCEGILSYLPLTSDDMVTKPLEMQKRVLEAVESLKQQGADLIGLGGFTGIIGGRGETTAKKAGIPVTTGNSLTSFSGYEIFLKVCEKLELKPQDQEIVIIGYPGSISLVIAKLLLIAGCNLTLVHRRIENENENEKLRNYISEEYWGNIKLTNNLEECYRIGRFFLTASSSGGIIDTEKLAPGSVVIDIALPKDVKDSVNYRNDILIIDGGNVSANGNVSIGSEIIGMGLKKQINGCLAETLILTLEEKNQCYSLGRELHVDKVLEIGHLAKKHGFDTWPIASYGEKITQDSFTNIRRFHHPDRYLLNFENVESFSSNELQNEALNKYINYINPVFGEFCQLNKIEKVFIKGEGCHLYDNDGNAYLDMVAGYGCLNIGHNHPEVKKQMMKFLEESVPNFIQIVSVPLYASLLAEKLCSIAPGQMGKVFFSNSGTEAVEAALKLARASTGKSRIIYADNSYHGKTYGALSVTGREKHRKSFYPLLPDCTQIPFDNLNELEKELEKGNVAGFIVEPIQGEGGVIVPSKGYLKNAKEICVKYNALLIVDEIQTGFGRTGKMFACEHENVEPDILVLAKSLSGGIMPIGATLSKNEIWEKAYGTVGTAFLHSSTFGSNNMACIVGLTSISVIEKNKLVDNAVELGTYLKMKLVEISEKYSFIEEIRGLGMMLGIKFNPSFKGSINAFGKEISSRLPGNMPLMYRFMSDEARFHMGKAISHIEESLEDMFCLRFVTKLTQDHNILTFMTANHTKVMRIQSPLILTKNEADQFISAFAKVCDDMNTVEE